MEMLVVAQADGKVTCFLEQKQAVEEGTIICKII